MSNKLTLVFTEIQLESMISLLETVEAMQGCADGELDGYDNFDKQTNKEIRNIDRMLKMNGYKRN